MFLRQHFYHQHIRKAIIAFGTIFNQMTVNRKDANGAIAQSIRIPLAYSPKQKFLARIASVPGNSPASTAITLPRMGFEITGLQYNPSRKISLVTRNVAVGQGDNPNQLRSQYTSTPYDMEISLFVVTKNQDDGLQIVEQILPFFNPDFNVTIKDIPEMGITRDLQIILNSINYEDNYEGDFNQRTSITWTLTFTLALNFYGPVDMQGIIRTAIAKTYLDTATNVPISQRYSVTTDPSDATPEGTWDYVEQFDEYFEE